jgi:P-type E1-E2 ATPase
MVEQAGDREAPSPERFLLGQLVVGIDLVEVDFGQVAVEVGAEDFAAGVEAIATEAVLQLLRAVAAAEARSEHPLARGVVAAAAARSVALPTAAYIELVPGRGLRATVDDRRLEIGNKGMFSSSDAAGALDAWASEAAESGATPLYVIADGAPAGIISLADSVRSESAAAIRALTDRGISSWIVSGDRQEVVNAVAQAVGIPLSQALGGILPSGKADVVEKVRATHGSVGMVGDGINDAPALAAADVGISMGGGTEIAIDASAATLSGADPRGVPLLVDLARATTRIIKQNLAWAFGYNILLVPLAAGLSLPAFGIGLDPALAAAAMGGSSVTVVLNALQLRRLPLERDRLN